MRRILPLIMFLLMEALLISLGVWQLERKAWKEALLADLDAAARRPLLLIASADELAQASLFQRVRVDCVHDALLSKPEEGFDEKSAIARREYLPCRLKGGTTLIARTRWQVVSSATEGPKVAFITRDSQLERVTTISGRLYPMRRLSFLDRMAGPTIDSADYWRSAGKLSGTIAPVLLNEGGTLPPPPANNHFAYAVQWFLFAGVLGVIFALYQWRQRLAPTPPAP